MLILADDLTGAADAGAACVARDRSVVVGLGHGIDGSGVDIVAIDAGTRAMDADGAAAAVGRLVAAAPADLLLFKKIDSTLRGHLAVELAAALAVRRRMAAGATTILLAPAFPATGRTVVGGRPFVAGVPLEQTEVWRNEHGEKPARLVDMLATAGLAAAIVDLKAVRGPSLHTVLTEKRQQADVLICDAETDADLASIAAASIEFGKSLIFAGSAGLVGHVAASLVPRRSLSTGSPTTPPGPLLFVIGSMSSQALEQAATLEADGDIQRLAIPVTTLIDARRSSRWRAWSKRLDETLAAGRDAMVLPEADNRYDPGRAGPLRDGLAALAAASAHRIGGLSATGGDTARAVLDRLGVTGLDLLRELAPGVALSIARGPRPLGVVTKAGAFGGPSTMLDCRRALRDLQGPSVHFEAGPRP